jgi:hypothetical protein
LRLTAAGRQRTKRKETEIRMEESRHRKKGGCYEREKQRGKGKQEGATEKPEREEKDEEGEEEQVGRTASMIRGQLLTFDKSQ